MQFYIRKEKIKKYIIWVMRIGMFKLSINKFKDKIDIDFNFNNGWDK